MTLNYCRVNRHKSPARKIPPPHDLKPRSAAARDTMAGAGAAQQLQQMCFGGGERELNLAAVRAAQHCAQHAPPRHATLLR